LSVSKLNWTEASRPVLRSGALGDEDRRAVAGPVLELLQGLGQDAVHDAVVAEEGEYRVLGEVAAAGARRHEGDEGLHLLVGDLDGEQGVAGRVGHELAHAGVFARGLPDELLDHGLVVVAHGPGLESVDRLPLGGPLAAALRRRHLEEGPLRGEAHETLAVLVLDDVDLLDGLAQGAFGRLRKLHLLFLGGHRDLEPPGRPAYPEDAGVPLLEDLVLEAHEGRGELDARVPQGLIEARALDDEALLPLVLLEIAPHESGNLVQAKTGRHGV